MGMAKDGIPEGHPRLLDPRSHALFPAGSLHYRGEGSPAA